MIALPTELAVSAAGITRDPQRLQALCALWQSENCDVWVTLQGVSMTPSISPGSRLRLHFNHQEPALGDIIAFRRENLLVIHRLIRFDAQGRCICQGDGNSAPDLPVSLLNVVGVVTEVQPPGARVKARQKVKSMLQGLRTAMRMRGTRR